MAASTVLVLCLALASVAPHVEASKVTPVQQVLSMMDEMKVKAEKEMEEEQKIFATYTEWVDDQSKELAFEIKTEKNEIEELIAFIEKADNDVKQLGAAVEQLESDIAGFEKAKVDATKVREAEHAEYLKVTKEEEEAIDSFDHAVAEVMAQQGSTPQSAMMFLQRKAKAVPAMRRALVALQMTAHEPGAPQVAGYESQSEGVLGILEKTEGEVKEELHDHEEAEASQAHYYDLEMLHLSDSIKQSTQDRDEKASMKAQRASESGAAKGKLAATKTALAEDEKLTAEIASTYKAKSAQYAENQKVRKGELEALGKAIEIIADPSVAGSYSEHVNLAQVSSQPVTLLQLGSASKRADAKEHAVALLRKSARALSSRMLADAANQLSANPFAKVIGMIKEMITKLKEEAAAEAAHKAWCDEELKKNKLKRDKKTAKKNLLTAELNELTASIETMGKTIETLIKEQTELTKALKDATEQREIEHAKNTKAIADAKAGAAAVGQALTVLKEFYSAQAALIQEGKQVPEMAAYKGQQAGKGGIIGMLEVIESDFLRLDSDTTTEEQENAAEYETFSADATADKEAKHKEEVQTKLDKDDAQFKKSGVSKDLKAVQAELDKANEYYEYLKPQCLEVKVSYEERVAKRKQEIESLKEAYKILDGM
eukprot:gnl/TRDRNA2_/TRDRNA2_177964_c2_seq15.p1 gnl/TRDRNA2_/TRDRNA2_177964_c2~~gnl/TRDRNA2_/TRDRNA2_177964_c2_seq15.p1  ORF type:complete len:658 (+),score=256.78 gnl/TRDRNA2_/TRDRNA2_177964_c2_seq15:55-2028(+)